MNQYGMIVLAKYNMGAQKVNEIGHMLYVIHLIFTPVLQRNSLKTVRCADPKKYLMVCVYGGIFTNELSRELLDGFTSIIL